MRTAPVRAASIRPGTPSRLPWSSSSGSTMRPSSRRISTSTCCRPRRVLMKTDAVAHGEVAAFHQRAGQLARQIHVLEPLHRPGAGGEQGDGGAVARLPPGFEKFGGQALQAVLPDVEEGAELADLQRPERLRHHAAHQPAVLPRIADAVRRRRCGRPARARRHPARGSGRRRRTASASGLPTWQLARRKPGLGKTSAGRQYARPTARSAGRTDRPAPPRAGGRAGRGPLSISGEFGGRDGQRHRVAPPAVFGLRRRRAGRR